MEFYMVWAAKRRPSGFQGGRYLDWSHPPIGVYEAENPNDAIMAAAKDSDDMGTFFAIPGIAWGMEFYQPKTSQLGRTSTDGGNQQATEARLQRLLDQQEKLMKTLQLGSGEE
jgi:hypothetical protein